MKYVEHQSTPIQGKKSDDSYEMFKIIQAMIEKQSVKFDELKIDINEVQIKCESNFNELKYELNETLSHSLQSMNNRIKEIESSMTEKIDKQIQEVTENFECKINECNASSEYKFNLLCVKKHIFSLIFLKSVYFICIKRLLGR